MMSKTPYYAVIFTSLRTPGDQGYGEVAQKMLELAAQQQGFIGVESAREEIGITVSYWQTLEDISRWKKQLDHKLAQEKGKALWYSRYTVRICKVEREYGYEKEPHENDLKACFGVLKASRAVSLKDMEVGIQKGATEFDT
jgi:heme-degrading monooxygenase HmoA